MTTAPVRRERIAALDVLRALALFGMILVHFNDRAQGSGGLKATIDFFISGKSAAIFAILFGASFAVFLRSADARGEPVTARFLRRMAGLFAFGFIAEGVFGYNVLIGYAVWGCALLVLRHWSTPALIALAILCHLLSTPVFNVGVGGYQWAIGGPEFANEVQRSRVVAAREANTRLEAAAASDYAPARFLSVEQRAGVRVLAKQGPVPTHVLAWRKDLPPATKEKIRAAFLALNEPANKVLLANTYGSEALVAVDESHVLALQKALDATGRGTELSTFKK